MKEAQMQKANTTTVMLKALHQYLVTISSHPAKILKKNGKEVLTEEIMAHMRYRFASKTLWSYIGMSGGCFTIAWLDSGFCPKYTADVFL